MKKLYTALLAAMFVALAPLSFAVSPEDTTSATGSEAPVATTTSAKSDLTIVSVEATDANKIDITFNQPIDINSVRVTLVDQATRQNVRVTDYAKSHLGDRSVQVNLLNDLSANTAYILTVNTAMSLTNDTISAGVDAIREFTTGTFSSGEPEFNAPSNPNVAVATGTTSTNTPASSTGTNTTMSPLSGATASGNTDTTQSGSTTLAQELPATGFDAVFLLLGVLLVVGLVFMTRKRAQ